MKVIIMLAVLWCCCTIANCLHFGHHAEKEKKPFAPTHMCLTPPNTLKKVHKHIEECQHEVRINVFHEAFSLLHEHGISPSFHEDVTTTNFTDSDREILKFVEEEEHHHHVDGAAYSEHHHSDHSYQHAAPPKLNYLDPHSNYGRSHWNSNDFYKKNDAIAVPNKNMSSMLKKLNPYEYFDPNNGSSSSDKKDAVQMRRHKRASRSDIHPTAVTTKDRRIAGCLMYCLYNKEGAIDKIGYPTLDGLVNFYSDGVHEHGFFMTTLRAADYCLKGASIKYHVNRHTKPDMGLNCDMSFDIFDCISDKITEYCSQHHYHTSFHHDHHDHFGK